jgi:hypothetical protein
MFISAAILSIRFVPRARDNSGNIPGRISTTNPEQRRREDGERHS